LLRGLLGVLGSLLRLLGRLGLLALLLSYVAGELLGLLRQLLLLASQLVDGVLLRIALASLLGGLLLHPFELIAEVALFAGELASLIGLLLLR
jgi:hypothetical protein